MEWSNEVCVLTRGMTPWTLSSQFYCQWLNFDPPWSHENIILEHMWISEPTWYLNSLWSENEGSSWHCVPTGDQTLGKNHGKQRHILGFTNYFVVDNTKRGRVFSSVLNPGCLVLLLRIFPKITFHQPIGKLKHLLDIYRHLRIPRSKTQWTNLGVPQVASWRIGRCFIGLWGF